MALAYPTPLGGNPFKITYFWNDLQWGWSDTFYYSTSKDFTASDLLNAAAWLFQKQAAVYASDVVPQGVRVTALDNTKPLLPSSKQSQIFTPLQCAVTINPQSGFPSQSPWAAVLTTLPDLSGTYKRPWLIRGLTASWLNNAPAGVSSSNLPVGQQQVSANLVSWLAGLNKSVFAGAFNGNVGAKTFLGTYALKGRVKNPAVTFPAQIQTVALSADNIHLQFVLLPPAGWGATGGLVGTKVKITGNRYTCGRGGNGIATITTVAPVGITGYFTVGTTLKWCCFPQLPTLKSYGTMELVSYGLFGIQGVFYERQVKRDTGRPTTGTRGRQSATCC